MTFFALFGGKKKIQGNKNACLARFQLHFLGGVFYYKTGQTCFFAPKYRRQTGLTPHTHTHIYIYIWLLTYKSPTFTFCKPFSSPCLAQKRAKKIWPDLGQIFVFFFGLSGSKSPFPPRWRATTDLKSAYFHCFKHFFEKMGIFQKLLKTGDLLNC